MDNRDYPLTVRVTVNKAPLLLPEQARAFSSAVKAALEHPSLAPTVLLKDASIIKLLVCLASNPLLPVPATCYPALVAL
jgi:hypothetical protein